MHRPIKARIALAMLVIAVAAPSGARAEDVSTTVSGFVWANKGSLQPPLPARHHEWQVDVVDADSDGTGRLHAIWREPNTYDTTVTYRSSADGQTWSAGEYLPARATSLRALSTGEVHVFSEGGDRRRSSSGVWSDLSVADATPSAFVSTVGAGDALWVAYSTDRATNSSRAVYARAFRSGAWSTPERAGSISSGESLTALLVGSDGTVRISSGGSARVMTRAGDGSWTDVSTVNGVTIAGLGADGSGAVAAFYWTLQGPLLYRLEWARFADGTWSAAGVVSPFLSSAVRPVVAETAINGSLVTAWNACGAQISGGCVQLSARLTAGSTSWSDSSIGEFPRGERAFALTVRPDGLAVVLSQSPLYVYDYLERAAGGFIARESAPGVWREPVPIAPPVLMDNPPVIRGIEVAGGPDGEMFAAWLQENGDGLAVADVGRTPRIVFAARAPGGSWSSPELVSATNAPWSPVTYRDTYFDTDPDVVAVAARSDGAVYVMWRDRSLVDANHAALDRILGRLRSPSGAWGPIETTSLDYVPGITEGYDESRPDVVFDSSGALWVLDDHAREYTRSSSGTWTTGPDVVPATPLGFTTALAIGPDDVQYAAFEQPNGVGDVGILVSTRAPSDPSWSTPLRVDGLTGAHDRELGGIAIQSGRPALAWSEQVQIDKDDWTANWNRLESNGAWGSPKALARDRKLQIGSVLVTADNKLWMAWTRCPRGSDGLPDCTHGGNAVAAMSVESYGPKSAVVFASQPSDITMDVFDDRPMLVGSSAPTAVWWGPSTGRLGPSAAASSAGIAGATLTLTHSPDPARFEDGARVTATLLEPGGVPIPSTEIAWISADTAVCSCGRSTDAAGVSWTDAHPNHLGTTSVRALMSQGTMDVQHPIAWENPPPRSVGLTASPETVVAGGTATFRAVVSDGYGTMLPGIQLAWSIESGPGQIVTAASETNASGSGSASVRSTAVGETVVRIDVPGTTLTGTAKVRWTPGPASGITLSADRETSSTPGPVGLTALITDRYGNPTPAAGQVLMWGWTGPGAVLGVPATHTGGSARAFAFSAVAGSTTITITDARTGATSSATITWM